MKVGVGSFAFRWSVGTETFRPPARMTVLGLLKTSAAYGAEVVQVCDNLPLDGLSQDELAGVRQEAKRLGLELELGIRASNPSAIRRNLEVCSQIGSGLMRTIIDGRESLAETTRVIQPLVDELEERDLKLAIENHFRFTPVELAQMIETIGHPRVGICLDPLNSISHLVGPEEVFTRLAPYTLTVHVKDALAERRGTGFSISGCPMGEGLVDFQHLILKLKHYGKAPNILVESWMDRCDTLDQTLTQEHEWVRRDIQTLRSLL